jgi:hypothetical protein
MIGSYVPMVNSRGVKVRVSDKKQRPVHVAPGVNFCRPLPGNTCSTAIEGQASEREIVKWYRHPRFLQISAH